MGKWVNLNRHVTKWPLRLNSSARNDEVTPSIASSMTDPSCQMYILSLHRSRKQIIELISKLDQILASFTLYNSSIKYIALHHRNSNTATSHLVSLQWAVECFLQIAHSCPPTVERRRDWTTYCLYPDKSIGGPEYIHHRSSNFGQAKGTHFSSGATVC